MRCHCRLFTQTSLCPCHSPFELTVPAPGLAGDSQVPCGKVQQRAQLWPSLPFKDLWCSRVLVYNWDPPLVTSSLIPTFLFQPSSTFSTHNGSGQSEVTAFCVSHSDGFCSESTVGGAARVQANVSPSKNWQAARETLTWWWTCRMKLRGNASQQLQKESLGSCTATLFSIKNTVIIHSTPWNLSSMCSHFYRPPTLDIKDGTFMCKDNISKLPFHPNSPDIWHRIGSQTLKRKKKNQQGEMSIKLFLFVEYLKESGKWLGKRVFTKKNFFFCYSQRSSDSFSLGCCRLRLAAKQRCLERSPTNAARGKLPEKQTL